MNIEKMSIILHGYISGRFLVQNSSVICDFINSTEMIDCFFFKQAIGTFLLVIYGVLGKVTSPNSTISSSTACAVLTVAFPVDAP